MLYTRLPAVLRSHPLLCLCSQLLSVQASLSYQQMRPGLCQSHAITHLHLHQLSCDSLSLTHSCMCCSVCPQRLKSCSEARRREVRVAGWGVSCKSGAIQGPAVAVTRAAPCVHVSCNICCPTTVPLRASFFSVPLAVQLLSSCMHVHWDPVAVPLCARVL